MIGWSEILQGQLLAAVEYLTAGGWVVLPLAVLSLWLWSLIFYKLKQITGLRPGRGPARSGSWKAVLEREMNTGIKVSPDIRQARIERDRLLLEAKLDNQVKTILVLASVAPLLGLLGTVTGMITTFEVIARFGTGNARAMAGGISEALITTQLGLMIALPGLFLGNFISHRVDRMKARIRCYCLGLARAKETSAC